MKTVQCGRKADGYKFWALWKARGNKGMQKFVDSMFENAKYDLVVLTCIPIIKLQFECVY